MRNLDVFVGGVLMGTLHDTDPLSFSYSPECLVGLVNAPFSALIKPAPGRISTTAVTSFFENLLPEGDERVLLQSRYHVTTIFGVLSKVGGDTAGSVVVLPEGKHPQPDAYMPVSWDDIGALVNDTTEVPPAIAQAAGSTTTLSGAQHKLLLLVAGQGGEPSLPLNGSISSHILKPDIRRPGLRVFSSAINETLVMRLAHACKLPTAPVQYLPAVKSCLVERYDRMRDASGTLQRLYQADLCQLLNKPSSVKYESDGGPSFQDCYNLIKRMSAVPLTDCHNLVRWLFFNLMVGNNDTHAKNLSMLSRNDATRLAPFYDQMCTQVYAGLSNDFAFRIGKHFEPGLIDYDDLCSLAASLGVNHRALLSIAMKVAEQIETSLPSQVASLLHLTPTGSGEQILLNRVSTLIERNIRKFKARVKSQTRAD